MPPAADLIGNGTGGSRGALGTGSVFHLLGQKLIAVAQPHAAQKLGRAENELRYTEGRYHAGDRSVGFMELAASLGATQPHPLNSVAEALIGATYPNGCHIAEVEVDPETGAATIEKYIAVDDLGNVLNHTLRKNSDALKTNFAIQKAVTTRATARSDSWNWPPRSAQPDPTRSTASPKR